MPSICSWTDLPRRHQTVLAAHDFIWKHRADPYDLVVYQLGNSPCHDYMWPYLVRYPGLTVLHDGQLHHARGRCLLQDKREDHYRSEFCFNHPSANPAIAELGVAGLLGSLTYLWPMRRIVAEVSRLVVVHDSWLADEIRAELPDARIEVVPMGVPESPAGPDAGKAVRARHDIPADAILYAAFGKVAPEKRIAQILRAIAEAEVGPAPVHLLLCGEPVDHYDASADAERLGIRDRVTITGYIETSEMPEYIAAADVCLCLRWPSARETSASWLRCLAASRPTLVTDLVQLANVPAYDPRSWSVAGYNAGRDEQGRPVHPACVAIDILDEDHSLILAIKKLTADPGIQQELQRGARALWESRFTLDAMVAGYQEALRDAAQHPAPECTLPPHLLANGTGLTRALLSETHIPMERLWALTPTGAGDDVECS